jgi:hypothetical protein
MFPHHIFALIEKHASLRPGAFGSAVYGVICVFSKMLAKRWHLAADGDVLPILLPLGWGSCGMTRRT